jgi:hypothetical protein
MNDYVSLAHKFCSGEPQYEVEGKTWCKAFNFILANPHLFKFEKHKIHLLWIELGGRLREKIKNDELLLSILLLTLPKYTGNGLYLYRGECKFLFDQNLIGFCWTPDINVAKQYAQHLNAIESDGVLLTAFVPQSAILAQPNSHSSSYLQEYEYTCNPNLLKNIKVLESYKKQG